MTKPKLLWVADNIRPTGFQRVTSNLLKRLCDRYQVISLAVNHVGDPHDEPYQVYPAGVYGDPLGRDRIKELAEQLRPDIIVCLNDIWVLYDYWEQVKDLDIPFVAYFPVDSWGYVPEMVEWLHNCSRVITYTKFAAQVLRDAGTCGHIDILPHGLDSDVFFPVNKSVARQAFGVDPEAFVVFNGNRNQPRKRIDLTIKGFCNFVANHKDKPLKLHLHMGTRDQGWDIVALFKREALKCGIKDWKQFISLTSNSPRCQDLPEERLNLIYNTADVGINTSMGEGWGLVNFEQAACQVAQIVPAHSACAELFRDRGYLLPVSQTITDPDFNLERSLVDETDVLVGLETLYENPALRERLAFESYKYFTSERFSWDAIALQLHDILQEALNDSRPKTQNLKPKGFAKI